MNIEKIISLLSAATVLLLGYLQWRSQSKVQTADAADKIGGAYDKLLESMSNRIDQLEARVKKVERWANRLVQQIYDLGGVPVSIDTDPGLMTTHDK
jgi:cell division protein FtsB